MIALSPEDWLERPWYAATAAVQTPIWSEVYTTRSTESLVVTAAQPVYNSEEELLGVFSTTVSLAHINQFLESIRIRPGPGRRPGPSGRV